MLRARFHCSRTARFQQLSHATISDSRDKQKCDTPFKLRYVFWNQLKWKIIIIFCCCCREHRVYVYCKSYEKTPNLMQYTRTMRVRYISYFYYVSSSYGAGRRRGILRCEQKHFSFLFFLTTYSGNRVMKENTFHLFFSALREFNTVRWLFHEHTRSETKSRIDYAAKISFLFFFRHKIYGARSQ